MTTHALWYWSNNSSTPGTQLNIHIGSLTTTGKILSVESHGQMSFNSVNVTPGYFDECDMLWGIQYVASGGPPLDIITSAPGDQWFWRNMVAQRSDWNTAADTPSGGITIQTAFSINAKYRGQGNAPGGAVDIYVSCKSVFGVTTLPFYISGSADGYWS